MGSTKDSKKLTKEEYPHLFEQWDYERNGDVLPEDVSVGSSKITRHWLCKISNCDVYDDECVHRWMTDVCNRVNNGTGCPWCKVHGAVQFCKHNSIAYTHKKMIGEEWDYERNGKLNLDPTKLRFASNVRAYFLCKKTNCSHGCEHSYMTTISKKCQKEKPTGCPFCAKTSNSFCIHNSFLHRFPVEAAEWDYDENKGGPESYTCGSMKKQQWICKKHDIKWKCSIQDRAQRGRKCPTCKTEKMKILSKIHPELLKEWDYVANGDITPDMITSGSDYRASWLCLVKSEHKYTSRVANKTSALMAGCPLCRESVGEQQLRLYFNSHPEIQFSTQKSFPGLIFKHSLLFDAFIVHPNLINPCIIEFDGKQHFEVGDSLTSGDLACYERDRRKDEYCAKSSLHLLRIAYTNIRQMSSNIDNFFFQCQIYESNKKINVEFIPAKLYNDLFTKMEVRWQAFRKAIENKDISKITFARRTSNWSIHAKDKKKNELIMIDEKTIGNDELNIPHLPIDENAMDDNEVHERDYEVNGDPNLEIIPDVIYQSVNTSSSSSSSSSTASNYLLNQSSVSSTVLVSDEKETAENKEVSSSSMVQETPSKPAGDKKHWSWQDWGMVKAESNSSSPPAKKQKTKH